MSDRFTGRASSAPGVHPAANAVCLRQLGAADARLLERWGEHRDLEAALDATDRECIRSAAAQSVRSSLRVYFAAERSDLGPVGITSFCRPERDPGVGYLAYWIDPAYRGRGLGMAAAAATVAHAIDALGARAVRAVVRPENAASRRLLERLAFHIGARARLRGRPDDPLLVYFAPPRERTP